MNHETKRRGITRRKMFASAGVAAAGWMMLRDTGGADNPAANVEDRASAVRITALKPYPFGNRTILKLETNRKLTGWGEISQLPSAVAVPLVQSMFEMLDNENPTRIEHL